MKNCNHRGGKAANTTLKEHMRRRSRQVAIDETKRSFQDAPEVQQCYYVTGEVDFILIVIVGDMSESEDLTQRLFFPNENIRKFRTFIAMDHTKSTLRLNI